ncbi:MAG: hypothetical protein AB1607_14880 [Chloroflexota bacterium]
MRIPNLLAPPNKTLRYVIISLAFVMYMGVFFHFHHSYGTVITSLALFPVVLGSWYFGVAGGILTVLISIATDIAALLVLNHPLSELTEGVGYIIGNALLFFMAVIVGRMASILRDHNNAILHLEKLEKTRQEYATFLEFLSLYP